MQFDLAKNIIQQAIAEQGHRPGKKSGFKEKFESPQKLGPKKMWVLKKKL